MGLFDGWRRKKRRETTVQLTEPKKPIKIESDISKVDIDIDESTTDIDDSEVVRLIAEYEQLLKRREELHAERQALTKSLDSGEIDHDAFRKELMSRIQEASTVSDNLRLAAIKLTSLGYRGILH